MELNEPLGKVIKRGEKACFDTATVEGDKGRLSLALNLQQVFSPTVELRDYVVKGLLLRIYREEPKVMVDPVTFERRPEILDQRVVKQ